MTKQKSTKRALLLSALSLLMCVSMLIGSTFAWFTDSVTSGNNKIVAGSLKIDLELLDKESGWTSIKESKAPIFDYDLWEPGYTDVKILKVENEGTLALKWYAKFVSNEKLSILADVIDVYVKPSATELTYPADRNLEGYAKVGTVAEFVNTIEQTTYGSLEAGEVAYLGIALKMREEAGNEYQGLELGAFDIMILATQNTVESDSFGTDYDEGADDPIVGEGTYGGICWTLTESGKMTVSPAATPAPDANSGAEYEAGAWREAVVYDSKGDATAIGGYPYDVNAVKSLVIEEGVTSIGSFTAKFPNLTGEVVIPSTVTYIGQEAFQNCQITKLTFAEGGDKALCIAPGAFKKLAIKELILPADRPEIHIHCWAFNDCTSLKNVTIPANVTTFSRWTHVDYCGMDFVNGWDSQIFARCLALEKITFGSQAVHDLFFNDAGNTSNINSIGGVEIAIQD